MAVAADPAPEAQPFAPGPVPFKVRLRRMLLAGLLILTPVALTAYVLVWLFSALSGIFAPLVQRGLASILPPETMDTSLTLAGTRVLGFLLTVAVVLILGWLSTNVFGRRILALVEGLIARIPVAKSVYAGTKGVLEAVSREQTEAFKRVVLIEYPRREMYAVAFVTGNAQWPSLEEGTSDLLLVFLPTTPNPTSGYLLLVRRDQAVNLPITVEEGVRMVISGGILLPEIEPTEDAVPARMPAPA